MASTKIRVELTGVRPLMFDRYAGDNATQLRPEEKLYLAPDRSLTLPAVNLYSLLTAENGKSACKMFLGKQAKPVALGIAGFTSIDPFDIPILGESGPIKFEGFGGKITEHKSVARLARGIPNPKVRPVVATPWRVEFDLTYTENKYCSIETLRKLIENGGALGLGTFRPYFGRYFLSRWEEV